MDVAGLGLLSYSAWLLAEPAGVAAAGISVLALSWHWNRGNSAAERASDRRIS